MAGESAGECAYTFDPDNWELDTRTFRGDEDSPGPVTECWECHHESHDGSKFCIFHMDPDERQSEGISDREIANRVTENINEGGAETKQFIGAKFSDLDLSNKHLHSEDREAIDFRHITIDGLLDISESTIETPFILECSNVGQIEARETIFRARCSFASSLFRDLSRFVDTTFESKALFKHAEFRGGGSFGRAHFQDRADFNVTKFLNGWGNFGQVTFDGETIFTLAEFHEKARFYRAEFSQPAEFQNMEFRGDHTGFRQAKFHNKTQFAGSRFHSSQDRRSGGTTFHKAEFDDSVSFRRADFKGIVNLQNVKFFDVVEFEEDEPERRDFDNFHIFLLSGAYISEGNISRLEDGNSYFDFSNSTVGKLRINETSVGHNPFDYLRFYRTNFEGFDFRDYRAELSPDWEIHNLPNVELTKEPTPEGLESTYLKAKNGATNVGDQLAASHFFIKEMRYRRQRYSRQQEQMRLWSVKKFKILYKQITNWMYDKSAVYGERPLRVVGISGLVIILSALVYPLTQGIRRTDGGESLRYAADGSVLQFWEVLYFSITTFTTVGYGDYQPNGLFAQLIASLESFAGATLMALLIFVLGKQVAR